jgi:catechol 2,3-dioxygenase-like lactoylglutathione lyase family enzyme
MAWGMSLLIIAGIGLRWPHPEEVDTMLKKAHVEATMPAQDINRAKAFYADKLGLQPTQEDPGGLQYQLEDGSTFAVFPSSGAPSGNHTQLAFTVQDVVREVKELKSKGVKFEEYDSPGLKTVDGIADFGQGQGKGAWFKDSEGNLLTVAQLVRVPASRTA